MDVEVEEITEGSAPNQQQPARVPAPLIKIIMVTSITAGIQFGWAIRVSLLTPYIQFLGISHGLASLMWLPGPISSVIVIPLVGHCSDRCNSRFGRRSPFIVVGTIIIIMAFVFIGFAADIGNLMGDSLRGGSIRPWAVTVFLVGIWISDVAKNIIQGPCFALLTDLSAGNERSTRTADTFTVIFTAVGNVLGYTAGCLHGLSRFFLFTRTEMCEKYCADLKICIVLFIVLLVTLTTGALATVREKPVSQPEEGGEGAATRVPPLKEELAALKNFPRPMWILGLVTGLNWIAWHSSLLYATDWMGREVFGGNVGSYKAEKLYSDGVRAGALGLVLHSAVFGVTFVGIRHMALGIGGAKRVWGMANIFLAVCLALTVVLTKKVQSARHLAFKHGYEMHYNIGAVASALTLFAVLGIPIAITYSIPFALASIFWNTSGVAQGLSRGVLNFLSAVPQIVVSIFSGPWDSLFEGGNLPTLVVGAVAAAASGVLALTLLPSPAHESRPRLPQQPN